MGYKEGTGLGKSDQGQSQLLKEKNKAHSKDDMLAIQDNASEPESAYSDFAQRQMVCTVIC